MIKKNEEGDRNENNIKETIWDVHCIRMDKSWHKKRQWNLKMISPNHVYVLSPFFLLLFLPFAVRPIDERDSRNFLTQLSSVRM
jgi:hypothetical protein